MDITKELYEAKQAIEITLSTIEQARKELKTARYAGWWDIFGGGTFVSMFKRHKMKKANDVFEQLNYQIGILKRELNDIHMQIPEGIYTSGFDYVIDVFFDNSFVDFMVQSDIKQAMRQLDRLQDQLLQRLTMINEQLAK